MADKQSGQNLRTDVQPRKPPPLASVLRMGGKGLSMNHPSPPPPHGSQHIDRPSTNASASLSFRLLEFGKVCWNWHPCFTRFDYPITSNVTYFARLQAAQNMLLFNIITLGVWFAIIPRDIHLLQRFLFVCCIFVADASIMFPVQQLLLFPFFFFQWGWRIPQLLPCPRLPRTPCAVLEQALRPPPLSGLIQWDATAVKALGDEADHWLLEMHLGAIANAYGSEDWVPLDLDQRLRLLILDIHPDGRPDPLTEAYQMAVTAMGASNRELALQLLDLALMTANPDLEILVGTHHCTVGALALYECLVEALRSIPGTTASDGGDSPRSPVCIARALCRGVKGKAVLREGGDLFVCRGGQHFRTAQAQRGLHTRTGPNFPPPPRPNRPQGFDGQLGLGPSGTRSSLPLGPLGTCGGGGLHFFLSCILGIYVALGFFVVFFFCICLQPGGAPFWSRLFVYRFRPLCDGSLC